MNWNNLENIAALEQVKKDSESQTVMIFKHSTSCAISNMAINRLERSWQPAEVPGLKPYYLDLLRYREISNKIAEVFEVPHESPQVIVIKNGKSVYNTSHMGINYQDIKTLVQR